MGNKILLQKADKNRKTAEWAEQQRYYDVSISRYYYCLYQKATYIALKNGFFAYSQGQKDSHNQFIALFQKNMVEKLSEEEIVWIAEFGGLKQQRVNADYKLTVCDENQFNLGFKLYFQSINKILDRLAK